MENKLMLTITSVLLIVSCSTKEPFHEVKVNNPEFYANSAFQSYEDLSSPKFKALKEKYQLDTIFHGETDELKRILLLRNWIKKTIKINDPGPHAGDGSVESILDYALKGYGFNCGHFTAVQDAIMNAYGYVTRWMIVDVGVVVDYIAGGGHHAVNEIWLNSYHKWFMSDAKYDYHFEKRGIPLSAIEVRNEYFKNKAADITIVKGPEKMPIASFSEINNLSKELFTRIYTWLSWGKYNNRYVNWPKTDTDYMIVYEDDYTKTHKWLWNGELHWAYNTKYMNPIPDRNAIEWTPNTITSKVTIEKNKVWIRLNSNTPNFRSYQMKDMPEGNWKDVSNVLELKLKKDKNEMVYRTINLAGITGPEHKIIIER
jgi:hypothetical protein